MLPCAKQASMPIRFPFWSECSAQHPDPAPSTTPNSSNISNICIQDLETKHQENSLPRDLSPTWLAAAPPRTPRVAYSSSTSAPVTRPSLQSVD